MAQIHTLCITWSIIQDVEESYSEGGGSSSEETAYVSCSSDEEEDSSFITFEASPAQLGIDITHQM